MPDLRFVTILDERYPFNVRRVFNPPPFLVSRGSDDGQDVRAVAVVGTRSPSSEGLARAQRLGRGLAAERVTVLSGLAKGIDAAAHTGASRPAAGLSPYSGTGCFNPPTPRRTADWQTRSWPLVAPSSRSSFRTRRQRGGRSHSATS
jgi:hypothetical protein